MQIIKIKNLNKTFIGKEGNVEAVKNLNLTINEGEFVSIVGASGSGKSTLLHLIGGLDRLDSGEIYINEKNINDLRPDEMTIFRRRNIGFIFQFFNLVPILDVYENVRMPLDLDNYKVQEKDIIDLCQALGLKDKLHFYPNELSGGSQQRVSIARALITKPKIILADEPTGNLDSKNSEEVMRLLKLYSKKYGITVLLVTHDLNIASQSDRIIKMEDGKILE